MFMSYTIFNVPVLFMGIITWNLKSKSLWYEWDSLFIWRSRAGKNILFCDSPAPLLIAAIYWAVTRCQILCQVLHALSHLVLTAAFSKPNTLWILEGAIFQSELSMQLWQGKHGLFLTRLNTMTRYHLIINSNICKYPSTFGLIMLRTLYILILFLIIILWNS